MKSDEIKLNGLCKICFRRRKCPKAQQYLNLTECNAFKIHGLRGRTRKGATDN